MDLSKKRILVTGACGTIGQELVTQLTESHRVGELVALDNNESQLFLLEGGFANYPVASFFLGDVRDRDKLARKMRGIDLVTVSQILGHSTTNPFGD